MPTRNVSLPDELDRFINDKVAAGLYANASEVVRTALRNLEQDEREYEARLAALKVLIDEGINSDPADDVEGEEFFEQMRRHIATRGREKKEARVA
jgi:antitoxin ParD1/3/4